MTEMIAKAVPVIARLAPSPTGAQHVGNARTYLLAWLSARSQGGRVVLRIEDIDSPRVKPWAMQQAIDDLLWLGLNWDDGPIIQTQRLARYKQVLRELQNRELVYPCTCTRSDIEAAASAPHLGQEGPIYPGTCAHRTATDAPSLTVPFAWRFRTAESQPQAYIDLIRGKESCPTVTALGDFVVGKMDGSPAYQLAVVVDDHDQGVTEVIRGDDLVPSTFRQLALYQSLGWMPPRFGHVPLVVGPDGRRLAKRHGDTRISILRERGVPAAHLIGLLAWSAGLRPTPEPILAGDLLPHFDPNMLSRQPFTLDSHHWDQLSGT